MLIALLADIHANRQAFTACLDDAKARGAERHVLLGDFVGYGADPVWCIDKATELVAGGAIAVMGNHDAAVSDPAIRMNEEAQEAIEWTRGKLGQAERRWLAELPMEHSDEGRLYVHADASQPDNWIYVLTVEEAARSLRATQAPVTFCGHTHKPAIFSTTAAAKMTAFSPVTEIAVPLHGLRRWLCVLGSVGQPRDGNPRACYGLFDTEKKEIIYIRVLYDIEAAAAAIRAARLPDFFAERLFIGR